MKAVVVYESFWGNTAAVARAIAEGIGSGTPALSTAEADAAALAGADLIVAGAPVMGFALPREQQRQSLAASPGKGPAPSLSHPSMRSWLEKLPHGRGRAAAFDTRLWWSPGGSIKGILGGLERAGYTPLDKGQKFIVKGTYGPLKDGELDRARRWGADLAKAVG